MQKYFRVTAPHTNRPQNVLLANHVLHVEGWVRLNQFRTRHGAFGAIIPYLSPTHSIQTILKGIVVQPGTRRGHGFPSALIQREERRSLGYCEAWSRVE